MVPIACLGFPSHFRIIQCLKTIALCARFLELLSKIIGGHCGAETEVHLGLLGECTDPVIVSVRARGVISGVD